jgi:DNA-binding MarR family transcriptional regulator
MPRKTFDIAVTELAHAVSQLVRRVRAAGAPQELSWTESAVMARLDKGGPATTAELARAEGVRPQSMGATVAALEEMGIVERRAHPTDGRQVNIVLSAKGATLRKTSRDAKMTWLAQSIAELDEADRKSLFAAVDIIKRLAQS